METLFLHKEQIQKLLANALPNLVYPQLAFLRFLQASVDGELKAIFYREGKELLGFLPYFAVQSATGIVINSLPWFGSHGGCYVHKDADQMLVREKLLTELTSILASCKKNLISATISLSPFEYSYAELYKQILSPDIMEGRMGQILYLPSLHGEDDAKISKGLMAKMEQKARNSLRKGLRQGFTYHLDNTPAAINFLYKTHYENMLAIGGIPKTYAQVNRLVAMLGHICRIHIARYNNKNVAAMLCLHHKPGIEYMLPVIKQEFRPLQPLSFLIHTALIEACKNAYKYWNFGGTWTTQHSLYHFKKGWGAYDCPYAYCIVRGSAIEKLERDDFAKFSNYFIYPFNNLKIR